jgi:hypothetical protein
MENKRAHINANFVAKEIVTNDAVLCGIEPCKDNANNIALIPGY